MGYALLKDIEYPHCWKSGEPFNLHNRRYIGNKHKLSEWIFSAIKEECRGNSFADIFAGTGAISACAGKYYDQVTINDFLHSNHVVYKAFFAKGKWRYAPIDQIINEINNIRGKSCGENYFSKNYGGKYFSHNSAKIIGVAREKIKHAKSSLTPKEYYILLASLLYSVDKIANTVGHYDAYFKKPQVDDTFVMRPIMPLSNTANISIYQRDANQLAGKINADIVYIDPPYNSRQYSRFYHILETLTKWDNPALYGVALKPIAENMSDYCRIGARQKFTTLISDINARYLVVSYNNTYNSKSSSSRNTITLEDMYDVLSAKGKTKVQERQYRHFNAGNTNFNDHKECLFITQC